MTDTYLVPLGRDAMYGTLEVDFDTLFALAHIKTHVWQYGIRQILNDAIADKTDDDGNRLSDADIKAKAQKRLDSLMAGELRTRSAGEALDPVEAEAVRRAKIAIADNLKKGGYWPTGKGLEDRLGIAIAARCKAVGLDYDAAGFIREWLKMNPEVTKAAKRSVEEAKKAQAQVKHI